MRQAMDVSTSITDLQSLVTSGRLRIAYVLAVPRSNSTLVCRLLGARLDGAVYEPAMPNSRDPMEHYGRTILTAYEQARARIEEDRPVTLVVKDLDGFIEQGHLDFIAENAHEVIFTIRDPGPQHLSLVNQFIHEFSPLQRLYAHTRYPVEHFWFTIHTLSWVKRYWRLAGRELGNIWRHPWRAAVAGFNFSSWRNQSNHLETLRERLGKDRITIFDAGVMRLMPKETEQMIDDIAHRLSNHAHPPGEILEVAGHSRMKRGSKWAAEARSAHAVKPFRPDRQGVGRARPNAYALAVADALYPQYLDTFFDPAHTQRRIAHEREFSGTIQPELARLIEADRAEDIAGDIHSPAGQPGEPAGA
ncbi:hypothetical protein [Cucumibacter marinus]|uniref:hypothetical protein n=1 Tax=Cucumibacter marinus TaxID=1121252 RepID=UPI00055D7AE2|nr:hypothetical protein [Cucumibacter marinus]